MSCVNLPRHENTWKCCGTRSPATDRGRTVASGEVGCRGDASGAGVVVRSETVESRRGARRSGGTGCQAASREAVPAVPASETTTGEDPRQGSSESRLHHGFVDVSASGRGDRTYFWGALSRRSCVAHFGRVGLELSEARATGAGA